MRHLFRVDTAKPSEPAFHFLYFTNPDHFKISESHPGESLYPESAAGSYSKRPLTMDRKSLNNSGLLPAWLKTRRMQVVLVHIG